MCSRIFDSNGRGALSKAVVFRSGRVPVIGAFPGRRRPPRHRRSEHCPRLWVQFSLPDANSGDRNDQSAVFPFKDPQAFYDNLVASQRDPNTHQPDPAKGAAFLASHPETARALASSRAMRRHPVSTTPPTTS